MADVCQLKRAVLGLSDPELRTVWFGTWLETEELTANAAALDALIDESERGDPSAKEVMFSLIAVLVAKPEAGHWQRYRAYARSHDKFALQRLLRRGVAANMLVAPSELPVPDYRTGRELTLGERRSLARRPNRAMIARLIADPHPMVIHLLLRNPKLVEDDVVRMAVVRPARVETLFEIARCERWLRGGRVRLSLLFNPGTPTALSVPLVFLSTRPELKQIVDSPATQLVVRDTARELLERRPPRARHDTDSATVQ